MPEDSEEEGAMMWADLAGVAAILIGSAIGIALGYRLGRW
jgi:hypothetical protein